MQNHNTDMSNHLNSIVESAMECVHRVGEARIQNVPSEAVEALRAALRLGLNEARLTGHILSSPESRLVVVFSDMAIAAIPEDEQDLRDQRMAERMAPIDRMTPPLDPRDRFLIDWFTGT